MQQKIIKMQKCNRKYTFLTDTEFNFLNPSLENQRKGEVIKILQREIDFTGQIL